MGKDIFDLVQGLDGVTAVRFVRHAGSKLFKDPEILHLMESLPRSAGALVKLGHLSAPQMQELLTTERSIWLAHQLLAELALRKRIAKILADAWASLPRDELVVEATIPRGLATSLVTLLASAREAESAGAAYSAIPGRAVADPLEDLMRVAVDTESVPLPASTPGAPAKLPASKGTRTVWPHLECDEIVAIGSLFELEVGLRAQRDPRVGGTGKLTLPADGCRLVAQLMFDSAAFSIVEGQRSYVLDVSEADPYPRVSVKMVALSGSDLQEQRDIGVMYQLGGAVVGYASRVVSAVASLAEVPRRAPARPFAGIDLAEFRVEEEADLTIVVKRGDDASGGRIVFAACSPHADLLVGAEPPSADLGSHPAKFLEYVVKAASTSSSPFSLFTELKGLGRQHIATKLPLPIKDALRSVASRVAPRAPSVLIISDDPYVPWELAVIEPPLVTGDSDPSPFLGAQVALGRWILPSGERPAPRPGRRLQVREQAVVTGVYERIPGWKRLDKAEQEARDLLKAWEGTGQEVDATLDDVVSCLRGHPAADVLHFALHGQFDAGGLQEGLVLIERPRGESDLARPTFLRSNHVASGDFTRAPFVFLNACQVGAGRELLGDYAGMAAAFLFAGASAVIAPLWSIDDADARGVALEFYEDAWKGEGPAELLRRQRARFTELAARKKSVEPGSPTHLAYQFFGHPKYVLERLARRADSRP